MWDQTGVTREVLLVGGYAIKIPKLIYGWRNFLQGLMANMQEVDFSRAGWPELCPIVFAVPGGWLTVMRRARVMTESEWVEFDVDTFCNGSNIIPAEPKHDSFGWLDGKIVAIDYGS